MNDAILASIRPKAVARIMNGEQTTIIFKTAPKDWMDYLSGKTKIRPKSRTVHIYCTKEGIVVEKDCGLGFPETINGKVVAKFTLDNIKPSHWSNAMVGSCMTPAQIDRYMKGKTKFYGWCISNLVVYDKPKELWQFRSTSWCNPGNCFGCPIKENFYYNLNMNINENYEECKKMCLKWGLTQAPRSWMYAEEKKLS